MPEFDPNVLIWLYEVMGWFFTETLGLPEWLAKVFQRGIPVAILAVAASLTPILTIWIERKVAGRFQDRLGPNRVGPWGIFQSFADVLKLLLKEMIIPAGADKVVYIIAPGLAVVGIVTIWGVIPLMEDVVGANLDIGVIYVMAVSGLHTLALMMGGWSSNNKYSLLGAFRAAAQLLSYEVPLLMALMVPVILSGSMSMVSIVEGQSTVWYVVLAPVAALLFFVSSVAEIGRAPFDLLEGESEIVAGYQVEYSGMAFGMFMLSEFMHAFTISALTAVLFLGGWHGPFVEQVPMLGLLYTLLKTFAVYFVVVWFRSSLPRVRIDHLMGFNWKFLVPVVLVLVMGTVLVDKVSATLIANYTDGIRALIHFIYNAVFVYIVFLILSGIGRRQREADNAAGVTWSFPADTAGASAPEAGTD